MSSPSPAAKKVTGAAKSQASNFYNEAKANPIEALASGGLLTTANAAAQTGKQVAGKPAMPAVPGSTAVPELPQEAAVSQEQQAAIAEEARRQSLARGRKSTILTSAQGVLGQANIKKKTLLGA